MRENGSAAGRLGKKFAVYIDCGEIHLGDGGAKPPATAEQSPWLKRNRKAQRI